MNDMVAGEETKLSMFVYTHIIMIPQDSGELDLLFFHVLQRMSDIILDYIVYSIIHFLYNRYISGWNKIVRRSS